MAAGPQFRAPVNVAFEIYKGCVTGLANNESDLPSNSKDANEWLQGMDHWCIDWTSAWTPAFTERPLTDREIQVLEERRMSLLHGLYNELAQISKFK